MEPVSSTNPQSISFLKVIIFSTLAFLIAVLSSLGTYWYINNTISNQSQDNEVSNTTIESKSIPAIFKCSLPSVSFIQFLQNVDSVVKQKNADALVSLMTPTKITCNKNAAEENSRAEFCYKGGKGYIPNSEGKTYDAYGVGIFNSDGAMVSRDTITKSIQELYLKSKDLKYSGYALYKNAAYIIYLDNNYSTLTLNTQNSNGKWQLNGIMLGKIQDNEELSNLLQCVF